MTETFSEKDRSALYRVMYSRRDVRSEFLPKRVPDDVLGRILDAAHHAPSVGLMQPWDFVLIDDLSVRAKIQAHFAAMKEQADLYNAGRRELYSSLKLEGILEAPLNVCITCDRGRTLGHGLGRQSDAMTDVYSTVCAVQNFWLAARAESVGVGWVSILDLQIVKQMLGIPAQVDVVAYLCVGYVSEFRVNPELEEKGWERRARLSELLHFNSWSDRDAARAGSLCGRAEAAPPLR